MDIGKILSPRPFKLIMSSLQSWYVYILQSCSSGKYYIGSTINVEKRISEHDTGYVISTRNKGPWILVFKQEFDNIKIARQIEIKLKKFKRKDIIMKIIQDNIINLKNWYLLSNIWIISHKIQKHNQARPDVTSGRS